MRKLLWLLVLALLLSAIGCSEERAFTTQGVVVNAKATGFAIQTADGRIFNYDTTGALCPNEVVRVGELIQVKLAPSGYGDGERWVIYWIKPV